MTRTHVRELEEGWGGGCKEAFFCLIIKLPSVRNSWQAGFLQGKCIPGDEAATQGFCGKGVKVDWPAESSWSSITGVVVPGWRGSLQDGQARAEQTEMDFGLWKLHKIKPWAGSSLVNWTVLQRFLKLKLQYFGHLMQTVDLQEKTLMLEKIEGRKRRGQQRTRWLDSTTDSTDMNLSKLWKMVKDREAERAAVHGGHKELDMT